MFCMLLRLQVARVPRGKYTYFTFPPPQQQATFTITAITSGAVRGYLTNDYHRASATEAQAGVLPTSEAFFWSTNDPDNVNSAHGA